MNTIERDGNVYEIGKVYEFSDNGEKWFVSVLIGTSKKAFESAVGHRKFIREFMGEIGAIKQAPVKLIDGEVYRFDFSDKEVGLIGVLKPSIRHGSEYRMFCNAQGQPVYNSKYCTNIVRLVPEEK